MFQTSDAFSWRVRAVFHLPHKWVQRGGGLVSATIASVRGANSDQQRAAYGRGLVSGAIEGTAQGSFAMYLGMTTRSIFADGAEFLASAIGEVANFSTSFTPLWIDPSVYRNLTPNENSA